MWLDLAWFATGIMLHLFESNASSITVVSHAELMRNRFCWSSRVSCMVFDDAVLLEGIGYRQAQGGSLRREAGRAQPLRVGEWTGVLCGTR